MGGLWGYSCLITRFCYLYQLIGKNLTWTWTPWLTSQIVWGHHSMPHLGFYLSVFLPWGSTSLQCLYQPGFPVSLLCYQINFYDRQTLRITHPAEWINANRWLDSKVQQLKTICYANWVAMELLIRLVWSWNFHQTINIDHLDGLAQNCSNCITNVLELLQACNAQNYQFYLNTSIMPSQKTKSGSYFTATKILNFK